MCDAKQAQSYHHRPGWLIYRVSYLNIYALSLLVAICWESFIKNVPQPHRTFWNVNFLSLPIFSPSYHKICFSEILRYLSLQMFVVHWRLLYNILIIFFLHFDVQPKNILQSSVNSCIPTLFFSFLLFCSIFCSMSNYFLFFCSILFVFFHFFPSFCGILFIYFFSSLLINFFHFWSVLFSSSLLFHSLLFYGLGSQTISGTGEVSVLTERGLFVRMWTAEKHQTGVTL